MRNIAPLPEGPVIRAAQFEEWHTANSVLQKALLLSRSIEEKAHASAESMMQELKENAAREAAEHQAAQLLNYDRAIQTALAAMEERLPHIVCHLVSEIIGDLPPQQTVQSAVAHALNTLRPASNTVLRLAPDTYESIAAFVASDFKDHHIVPILDPTLPEGTCRLENELGSVELGLEGQLRVLREALTAHWQQPEP